MKEEIDKKINFRYVINSEFMLDKIWSLFMINKNVSIINQVIFPLFVIMEELMKELEIIVKERQIHNEEFDKTFKAIRYLADNIMSIIASRAYEYGCIEELKKLTIFDKFEMIEEENHEK